MLNLAVIMSVYHKDKISYLRDSVDSILKQTYSSFDFYIQADGPLNEEMHNYLLNIEDERIVFFERRVNKGLAYSLNELLRIVLSKKYQFIARMDADDISLPDRFEKQIHYMNLHPNIDALGTWATEIDNKGEDFFKKTMPETHVECLELFKKRDCIIHPTVMFRYSYFKKAGIYPENTYFGEDTMMWAKGFQNGCNFGNLPELLFKFRLDETFFDRRRGWKHAKSILLLRLKVNKMLGFNLKCDFYAVLYALIKLMPNNILRLLYRTIR